MLIFDMNEFMERHLLAEDHPAEAGFLHASERGRRGVTGV